jgi:osmotically-inducible protein OsmY
MNDETDLPEAGRSRFTPDTLPGAGPTYGPNQPYNPASPVPQNEQQPLEGAISDTAVIAAVKEALKRNRELAASQIEVMYDHGVVILTGSVRGEVARELAGEAALTVRGVTAVDNDLELRSSNVNHENQKQANGE